VSLHFLPSSKRSYVLRKAAKAGKALMVLITRPGCGACQNLKQSVNMASGVKGLLAKGDVLVVHAEGAAAEEWMLPNQNSVPQTYFYAPGEDRPLPIHGTSDGSPHFFHDEATMLWGLEKMVEVVRTGQRSNDEGRTDL
jgi:hypothetical protein